MKRALIPYVNIDEIRRSAHDFGAKIHVHGDDFDGFLRVMTDGSDQM
jgi:hypothetical protein